MPIRNTDLKRVGKNRVKVKSPTGKVHAKSTTPKKAKAQQRLLNAIDQGWEPKRQGKRSQPKRQRSKRSEAIARSKARKRHRYKPMFDYSPRLIKGLTARSNARGGR